MATADPRLVVAWTGSQLTRICQLLYLKYPSLQNIKYTADDFQFEIKMSSPSFIMAKTDKGELFMLLRIQIGNIKCPSRKLNWKMENWDVAYRCNLSQAKLKGPLSSESLFRCFNTILDPEINQTHSLLDDYSVDEFKSKTPGTFEAIDTCFRKWMSEQLAKGLTQWGYRFPLPAKSAPTEGRLTVMDPLKMAGLSDSNMQSPRGVFYFEPPLGVQTLDYLEEKYRNAIGLAVWTASKRDPTRQDAPPRSLDEEAQLDKSLGVGTLCTHCDPALLDDEFRSRTQFLKTQDPTVDSKLDPRIVRSKIEAVGFIPGADIGGATEWIPPIRAVVNKPPAADDKKPTLRWEADCQGLRPIAGRPMSMVFKGVNKTSSKVDFLYLQFRCLGGSSGQRLVNTSAKGTLTATVGVSNTKVQVQAKVYHSSFRGTTRVVVQVSSAKQTENRIRLAPDESIEIEVTGLAGTAATHSFDMTESLEGAQGQSGTRRDSKWELDIAPAT